VLGGRLAGLYELDREVQVWRPFRPFFAFPHVEEKRWSLE
jgi:hypothetical protein